MKIFMQLMYIFSFSFIGDIISKLIKLPIPGSVIGMILLFLALEFKIIKLEKVETVSEFFASNLSILFVPAGVGIITKYSYIKDIWLSFFLIAILTTIINLILVSKVVEFIKKKFEDVKK